DDVEGVPEKTEAEVAPLDVGTKPLGVELRHHRAQPEQARGDMHAVATDQGEERREEGAAGGAGTDRHQMCKLTHFKNEEDEPEGAGGDQGHLGEELAARLDGETRHPAAEARRSE